MSGGCGKLRNQREVLDSAGDVMLNSNPASLEEGGS